MLPTVHYNMGGIPTNYKGEVGGGTHTHEIGIDELSTAAVAKPHSF